MNKFPEWWDPYSDQPYKLKSNQKPRGNFDNLVEYTKVASTALSLLPALVYQYCTLRATTTTMTNRDFVGLSIAPDPQWEQAIVDLVAELNVKELLIRVPGWIPGYSEKVARFIELFPDHRFLINILQCTESVQTKTLWEAQCREIFNTLSESAETFQIGNAINRSKWGCRHSGEALDLFYIADQVRKESHPHLKLMGSSVIDFEPLIWIRTLVNYRNIELDGCASQLYINRRGSAFDTQYRFFNLERKIRLNYAILSLSNCTQKKLWITETNWPLLNTKPYTPNSGHPRSTVDEETQAVYLKQYYEVAKASGFVEKVYWWQLINPGYGLIDHRSGSLRKMPSFHAFKNLLSISA